MKPFKLSGVIKRWDGNGRKFGYPTANIEAPEDAPEGLFVGHVILNKKSLPAMIFIGAPITLNDQRRRAEAHILDFEDRDLYGESVIFEVESKLRDNVKFEGEEKLIEQMKKDEVLARKYFKGS